MCTSDRCAWPGVPALWLGLQREQERRERMESFMIACVPAGAPPGVGRPRAVRGQVARRAAFARSSAPARGARREARRERVAAPADREGRRFDRGRAGGVGGRGPGARRRSRQVESKPRRRGASDTVGRLTHPVRIRCYSIPCVVLVNRNLRCGTRWIDDRLSPGAILVHLTKGSTKGANQDRPWPPSWPPSRGLAPCDQVAAAISCEDGPFFGSSRLPGQPGRSEPGLRSWRVRTTTNSPAGSPPLRRTPWPGPLRQANGGPGPFSRADSPSPR